MVALVGAALTFGLATAADAVFGRWFAGGGKRTSA
jgi:hypothetical protein